MEILYTLSLIALIYTLYNIYIICAAYNIVDAEIYIYIITLKLGRPGFRLYIKQDWLGIICSPRTRIQPKTRPGWWPAGPAASLKYDVHCLIIAYRAHKHEVNTGVELLLTVILTDPVWLCLNQIGSGWFMKSKTESVRVTIMAEWSIVFLKSSYTTLFT